MPNKDNLRKDIEEMKRLESRLVFLSNEIKSTARFSEKSGLLFKLQYKDDYNQWFIDTFDRFKDREPTERINGYYFVSSYGTKEDKQKLWDKRHEIRQELIKPYTDESEYLYEELQVIKDKYDKYFNCMYDMEYDGGSPMVDFLEVALNMMEDY